MMIQVINSNKITIYYNHYLHEYNKYTLYFFDIYV